MTPTQLYRHFDAADRLLYIGISCNAWKRLQQHLSSSPWGKVIVRMTVEDHPTRGAAIDAEAAAILAEQPPFNKEGRRRGDRSDPRSASAEMAKLEHFLASHCSAHVVAHRVHTALASEP